MSTSFAPLDRWQPGDSLALPAPPISEIEFEAWAFRHDDIRAEWVDGEIVIMSPVGEVHDNLFHWLARLLGDFVEEAELGRVLGPEFMVRFGAQRSRRLPDILFVARLREGCIKRTYLDGPPDLIVEIVSEDSHARDWHEEYAEYEQAGVQEYWLVDPLTRRLEAFHLGGDGRCVGIEEVDGRVASKVIVGWYLRSVWLWDKPRLKVAHALREMESALGGGT